MKCTVVTTLPERVIQPLTLAGQPLRVSKEAKYLCISVSGVGFSKKAGSALETKCRAACAAVTSQSFFDVRLSVSTIRTMYWTNVRRILLYGTPIVKEREDLERLDEKMLQIYFQRLMNSKENLNEKLLGRMCIRISILSLRMEIERQTRKWTLKLGCAVLRTLLQELKCHAEDAVEAIGTCQAKSH